MKRQLKGYIGKDVGRFFVRHKDQSLVPIDSSLFMVRAPDAVTADADLRVCGYVPSTPSTALTSSEVSCASMPKASTYTDACIGTSDPTCRPAQLKVWTAALSAWSAQCGGSGTSGSGQSTASCGAMPTVGSYTSQCSGSDFYCYTSQKSKWQAALEAWSACNRAGATPTDQFDANSNYCIVNGSHDARCGNYDGILDDKWWD